MQPAQVNNINERIENNKNTTFNSIDSQPTIGIKKEEKHKILTQIIYPYNEKAIKSLLNNKAFYSKMLLWCLILKIIIVTLTIPGLLISSSYFDGQNNLKFIATFFSFFVGCLEALCTMILKANKSRTEKINALLRSMGIDYKDIDTTVSDAPATVATSDTTPKPPTTDNSRYVHPEEHTHIVNIPNNEPIVERQPETMELKVSNDSATEQVFKEEKK